MKAVIFANQKFDNSDKPKAFAKIMGKSLLEYNLELVENCVDGVIVVCRKEFHNLVPRKDGIVVCDESELLKILKDSALFMDGGAFYTCDIEKFIDFHRKNSNNITVALSQIQEPSLISVSFENNKALESGGNSGWRFNNLYVLEKNMVGININRYLKNAGENEVSVYPSKENYFYVNSVWDLMKISFTFINKNKTDIHKSTFVDESALVSPLSYIGKNCKIGKFVKIGAYTVIEDNCIIKDGAEIKYSSVCNNSYVGKNSEIEFSYVMENSTIGDRCVLRGGNVVEQNFVVCNDSVIEENMPLGEKLKREDKKVQNTKKNINKLIR